MAPYKEVALPPTPHPGKPTLANNLAWLRRSFPDSTDHSGRDPNSDAGYADLLRRHYAACVTYADKHVGEILDALKEAGAEQNTVVVLWGDHGWHLGEHAIWGKHCLFGGGIAIAADHLDNRTWKRRASRRMRSYPAWISSPHSAT